MKQNIDVNTYFAIENDPKVPTEWGGKWRIFPRFLISNSFLGDDAVSELSMFWREREREREMPRAPSIMFLFLSTLSENSLCGKLLLALASHFQSEHPTNHQRWYAEWKLSRNVCTLSTRFCTLGADCACSVGAH